MSITESVGTALAYHNLITIKLQEFARQRSAKLTDFTTLLSAEDFTTKERSKREIAQAVEKDKRDQQAQRDLRTRAPYNQRANNQRTTRPTNSQRSRSRSARRTNTQNLNNDQRRNPNQQPGNTLTNNQRNNRDQPRYGRNQNAQPGNRTANQNNQRQQRG